MILDKTIEVKYFFDDKKECIDLAKDLEAAGFKIIIYNDEIEHPYLVARRKGNEK